MVNEVMKVRHVTRSDLNIRINKKHLLLLLALIGKASWEIGCTELNNAPDFIFPPVISD